MFNRIATGGLIVCLLLATVAVAQSTRPAAPPAASRIVAVTVYQQNALVTREVVVPAGPGQVELVVAPLPTSTIGSTLYSEGTDGIRVLTTRYRTTVLRENVAEEVRKIDAQVKELERQNQATQRRIEAITQNVAFMGKMEEFTAGALKQMTEKGQLNSESVTKLAEFIMTTRLDRSAEIITLQQKMQSDAEQLGFLKQERSKVSAGSDRVVREAVIVVDRAGAAAEAGAAVRLNYMVSSAAWKPQYKLRASLARDKSAVLVEYLAAISQQTGEDWTDVDLVLSTAQPLLSAAPPELAMLEIDLQPLAGGTPVPGKPVSPTGVTVNGGKLSLNSGDNVYQQQQAIGEAVNLSNSSKQMEANRRYNDAAAIFQADEILNADVQRVLHVASTGGPSSREGQSVTFHLERRLTVPWRDDEQLIEMARIPLKPDFFYKAVPVLTQHVYRLANLTNDSNYVILPGEATMYIDTDFVGRAALPLVAIGEQFTAAFGVDPQLQVSRAMVEKARSTQGGNQVLTFDYRLSIGSYKGEAVKMQVWDRLPHSEKEAVNVTLTDPKPELSKDPTYLRDDRTKNLLRWDLTIDPNTAGEKATVITYKFRMEFDRNAAIGNFLSK